MHSKGQELSSDNSHLDATTIAAEAARPSAKALLMFDKGEYVPIGAGAW
jgi:hypothetical protein